MAVGVIIRALLGLVILLAKRLSYSSLLLGDLHETICATYFPDLSIQSRYEFPRTRNTRSKSISTLPARSVCWRHAIRIGHAPESKRYVHSAICCYTIWSSKQLVSHIFSQEWCTKLKRRSQGAPYQSQMNQPMNQPIGQAAQNQPMPGPAEDGERGWKGALAGAGTGGCRTPFSIY